MISREEILRFLRSRRYAVQASASPSGVPQAAVVGVAVGDDFEIVFDTLGDTRKAAHLRANPEIAFVFGTGEGGDERTVQLSGVADEPTGAERERVQKLYFSVFPDGVERLAWPGLTHFSARPRWLRYSDFGQSPPLIIEITF